MKENYAKSLMTLLKLTVKVVIPDAPAVSSIIRYVEPATETNGAISVAASFKVKVDQWVSFISLYS